MALYPRRKVRAMTARKYPANLFVAIEGPNGSGKSHLARHLADLTGTTVTRFPAAFLDFRARNLLDDAIAPIPRLVYYLAGITHMSDEIAATSGPVVCDRYFASPLAMLAAEGTLSMDDVLEVSEPVIKRIVIPDLTVLLTAEPDVLRSRLEARAESRDGSSMRQTLAPSPFAADWMVHLTQMISVRGPMIEIDTTHRDRATVCGLASDAVADLVVAQ